jgi:rare lipoprotein A
VRPWPAVAAALAMAGAAQAGGVASVYSVLDNHGTTTASGVPLSDGALTAAHRTLPFGTRVRVTHAGRSVVVRITDRGPFVRGRVLDITPAAAGRIGCDGLCDVAMEVIE